MRQYVVRRLLMLGPVMVGVMVFSFSMLHLTPGDPAVIIAGPDAPRDAVEALREELGLTRPVYVQFAAYLTNVLSGNLGQSIVSKKPVAEEIRRVFGATLQLVVAAMAWAVSVAVVLGVTSAVHPGTWVDKVVMVTGLLGLSLPIFWIGLMLIWWLGFRWGVFPISGWGGPIWTAQGAYYTILPALTLGANLVGALARMTRATVLEVLRQDYIRTARAKGLAERRVVYLHALRNAALPIITLVGLQVGYLLGGAVVTETIFSWPGMGRTVVRAILSKDFPLVQGIVLTMALSFVTINLLVDLLYAALDPRIRYH
ncbi:MAG: ABC transporter permease [Armatimonadota bacterium]|nr:ABC transporter permease [Armatimonadota bacterium]MDR7533787.1 ABC transporter permease [Armatimonadota bacterium]MDR7535777.1 ABC transporter permease [Armatimonadota bacterium]